MIDDISTNTNTFADLCGRGRSREAAMPKSVLRPINISMTAIVLMVNFGMFNPSAISDEILLWIEKIPLNDFT